ncbi:hypothetical protein JI735_10990 [Paenibacillus sonchi]|uniref:YtkA-like domain-containing protein n=1 Tax=Paenibacillus sonchi TaxID=373687 RepID=A0A974SEY9_9BACL|nr:hypothetical protein [Paenibacillus sonchi]QQZ62979.1 hypothetical protein JI735_10990 [Paenibacillus sonchi]
MKKHLVLVVLMITLGCQPLYSDQSTAESTGADSTMTNIEKAPFSAYISVPQKVQTNKEFKIKADFKVNAEQKLTITSRDKMFVYLIKDSNGKQINTYAISDVGKNRTFSGEATISETYSYKFKEPGIYEISAIAEFTVNIDKGSKEYKIETDPQIIEVTRDFKVD